jgi:hypothetical protein
MEKVVICSFAGIMPTTKELRVSLLVVMSVKTKRTIPAIYVLGVIGS